MLPGDVAGALRLVQPVAPQPGGRRLLEECHRVVVALLVEAQDAQRERERRIARLRGGEGGEGLPGAHHVLVGEVLECLARGGVDLGPGGSQGQGQDEEEGGGDHFTSSS